MVSRQGEGDTDIIDCILESQLECFWREPDKYKEVIVARRQSANLDASQNLLSIESIPNFNMNRIELDKYSIVSPTAYDALDYYNYYLLDTVFVDGHVVFRLEVEPKNRIDPLVVGTIDIIDSTFDVVGAEGGVNSAVHLPFVTGIHYTQHFSEFENRFWMPVEIQMDYVVTVTFPYERVYNIHFVAALHEYNFNAAITGESFRYDLVVAENADDLDSASWNARQRIPLTSSEERGYARIDSIANAPKTLSSRALSRFLRLLFYPVSLNYDYFHFNRVEGAYLGFGHYWYKVLPRIDVDVKVGYAFERELWQYRFTGLYLPWKYNRSYVGLQCRDEIRHRPVILAPYGFNPALWNLFSRDDPLDYYRERGFELRAEGELTRHMRLRLTYMDYRQSSEVNNTDYSILNRDDQYRVNPAIADGKLRSLSVMLRYDSRKRAHIKGREGIANTHIFTGFEVGVEVASPELIDNDFDFIRYYSRFKTTCRTPLPGWSTLEMYLGGSSNNLPPQKYFTVDFSYALLIENMYFRTVGGTNFAGNRAAAIYLAHDFGSWCFRTTGLPLVKDIPLSLGIHYGTFWTDFIDHTGQPGDEFMKAANRPYREIGFSIGRIPPLSFRIDLTWQLSHYDTHDYRFGFGFSL